MLFTTPQGWHARELAAADTAALQGLFEARQDYFRLINGQDLSPGEAAKEMAELPPAGMPYRRLWKLGFFDAAGAGAGMAGMAVVISDFLAPGVGHIGLFMVREGGGAASYAALEAWMRDAEGQRWLRLGIVKGNERAEAFWARCGYAQLRERGPVQYGLRQNMVRVMMKPLSGGVSAEAQADYLALVARDRPDAP